MIPVDQTRFGAADGNCMEACVASILECGIDDVPNLGTCDGSGWIRTLNDWLAPRGLAYVEVDANHGVYGPPEQACIVSGPSPRIHGLDHACVGAVGERGCAVHVVHDPHPDRVGLPKGKTAVGFFVALRPEHDVYGERSDLYRKLCPLCQYVDEEFGVHCVKHEHHACRAGSLFERATFVEDV